MPRRNTESDFWSRMDRTGGDESCWPWLRAKSSSGYGKLYFGGKDWRSHRLAFYLKTGEKPQVVCHRCDNPACCNPAHLFGGTFKDNTQDMIRKGRRHSQVGERHSQSKLKPEQVIEIRKAKARGERAVDIAKRFSISRDHVLDICSGDRWPHLPLFQ